MARLDRVIPSAAPKRIASVDALRGFSIVWILGADELVRSIARLLEGRGDSGSIVANLIAAQFEHAERQGFRLYDLIFTLLIFVTG
jgi:hypothetical protein